MSWTPCPCGSRDARVVLDTADAFERRYQILECRRCGLRRPDVDPTEQELNDYYDGYGRYSDPAWLEAELARRRGPAQRLHGKLRRAGASSGRFLEIGCASGALLWNLSKISGLECYGVEIDAASAKAAEARLPGRIFHGKLEDAGYPSNHFAAAYCEQVIEHVPDVAGLLRETWRVLAPGGVVFFGTPNFRGLAARLLGTNWKEFIPSDHVRMFSPASLRWFLVEHGFRDVNVRTGGIALVRRDRRDLFPLRHDGLVARVLSRGLGTLRLGDSLTATARKPRGGAANPRA